MSKDHIQIETLISEQIPEFVTDNTTSMLPLFLEYYYEFMESEEEQNTFTRDILKYFDSFTTNSNILNGNFEEVSRMPHKMAADKRKFAKRAYDVYRAKGTEESFKLLFRLFFDIDVEITYPSQNILRASDGRWTRESEILVRLTYGEFTRQTNINLAITQSSGVISYKTALRATRVDSLQDYWLTFDAGQKIETDVGNRIVGYAENGEVLFVGTVLPSPTQIKVVSSGKGFRIGQVFRVTGTHRDSVFKVTSIGPQGTLTSCEMIQFGYGHPENLKIDISPYKNYPQTSSFTYTSSVVSPTEVYHQLKLTDAVYQISDRVSGGNFLVDSIVNEQTSGLPTGSIGLTISTYLASVATLSIVSGGVALYPGKWSTDDGRLNTPNIVLQDNYYYQPFSYVIHGDVNLTDYEHTLLPMVHPAGMKSFADMVKTVSFDITPSFDVYRIRKYFMVFDDVVDPVDAGMRKFVNKFFDEGKIIDRYVETGYWDDTYGGLDKVGGDNPIVVWDGISKSVERNLIETVTTSDTTKKNITKSLSEAMIVNDFTANLISKALIDGALITDFATATIPPYAVNGYWSTDYVSDQIILG
jgi:hypothetical protein